MSGCQAAACLLAGCTGGLQLLPACSLPAGCMGGRDRLHERLHVYCLSAGRLQGGVAAAAACLLAACWLHGGEGQVA